MRILISGGAGFIGSNLTNQLLNRGHDVVILDNLSPQIHGTEPDHSSPLYISIKDRVKFIRGNVCVREDWMRTLKDVEVVVHLAAETGTGQSMYQVEQYTDVNVGGTALLLDILANDPNRSVKKIVIASSRAIYGEGKYHSSKYGTVYPEHRETADMKQADFEVKYADDPSPLQLLPTDEESKIHPSSVYGITKQVQEQMVLCVCRSLAIKAVAFRYQNVYGPGQSLQNPYTGILSIFSNLIKTGKPINIFEDGKESRDFVYIDDVVRATILGIENEDVVDDVFNVGTGVATDVLTVANTLAECYGIKVPVTVTGNFRVGDIRHNYADLTKIRKKLGFEPAVNFQTGIRKFCDWVNQQEIRASRFEDSVNDMKAKGLFN